MLVEELGDLGGGGDRLLFGAAVLHRLGPQRLDARLETVEVGGLLRGRHITVPGVVQGRTGTAERQPGKERYAGSAAINSSRPGRRCYLHRSSDWFCRA